MHLKLKLLKRMRMLLLCLFFSYQRQLEFILLSINLQTTLHNVDPKPYGAPDLHAAVV